MPSIQYPDPEESTEYVNCKFAEGWVAPPATARVSYSNAIKRLMQTSKDDFKPLRGALRSEEKETQSLLGLIDARECTITNSSKSEPQLTCTLTGVNEQKQLDAQYDRVVKALKQVLTAEWEVEEEMDRAGQKQFGATWKNDDYLNGPSIRIHVRVWDKERLIKEYGKYELMIIFEGRFKMQGVARIQ
jgi:hypothetical protein